MIVTFFGHADFKESSICEEEFMLTLREYTKGESVDFYFGGYGGFDDFSYKCCCEFKKQCGKSSSAKLIFVTPYITESYHKNHLLQMKDKHDEIIYPNIENVPLRYAISARNKWMAEEADLIFCYVNHSWGGAYCASKYARAKGKRIINFGKLVF